MGVGLTKVLEMIKMPISEIADRYSICLLKSERLKNENIEAELNALKDEISQYKSIYDFVERLYKVNGEIWDLESDIRSGKEEKLGLEEVGRRAIMIRDLNKQRISIKNEIVECFNEGFREIKINHASQ